MFFDRRQCLPLVLFAVFGGCGGPNVGTSSGLTCVDDSPHCIERRQQTLSYLVDSNDRAWIKAHPPAEAYASGVRLFALQRKKKELTCEELTLRPQRGRKGAARLARTRGRQADAGSGLARGDPRQRSVARAGNGDETAVQEVVTGHCIALPYLLRGRGTAAGPRRFPYHAAATTLHTPLPRPYIPRARMSLR